MLPDILFDGIWWSGSLFHWANSICRNNFNIICPREYLGKSAIKSIYSSQPHWFHVSYHSHFCLNACKQCLLRWLKTSVHIFSRLASSCTPVQGNHTQQVFSRYRFGGGGQKPWWDANKKRFVTAQGAVLALDHHCPENVQNTNRLFQNTNRLFLGTLVGIMIIGILTIGILSLPRASSLRLTTTAIVTATGFPARSLCQTPFFLFFAHHAWRL